MNSSPMNPYTRAEELAKCPPVDVTEAAKELGFSGSAGISQSAWTSCVEVSEYPDEWRRRVHHILCQLRHVILRTRLKLDLKPPQEFCFYVRDWRGVWVQLEALHTHDEDVSDRITIFWPSEGKFFRERT